MELRIRLRTIVFFLFLGMVSFMEAAIFKVGPTKEYPSPNALYSADVVQENDTIEIDATTYVGQACLAVWSSDNLLIRGVGGQPHLRADGEFIWGKGIWVFQGNNITVEYIEFSEAAVPDQNGAGIRLDGEGLTVRHCYFHHNENGILTSNPDAGDILIEHSEFAYNGHGDGFSHNVYVGRVNSLTFRYNYSHHANIGHNLKSRAKENFIYYNRIMDEETGNSSRLIDISNGGQCILMGNLLMQGDNAPNNNMVAFGLEGLTAGNTHHFYVVNNTFVNKRQASARFLNTEPNAEIVHLANNIFGWNGNPYRWGIYNF